MRRVSPLVAPDKSGKQLLWLPHFTCKAVGDVLREAMTAHPQGRMTVLCGHTHGGGEVQVLPNLRVVTGGAVYGRPALQRVVELT